MSGHTIETAQSRGWDTLSNGELLNAAEEAGFGLLLTTDRRIRYQQNLNVRRIALVVLTGSTKWSLVQRHADRIAAATSGDVVLFAHGHILRILAAAWIRLPAITGRYLALDTATVSMLGYERQTPVIREWNVTPTIHQL